MKAIRFHEIGGPEVLVYEEVDRPVPGAGQVQLKVEAAGVNFADTARRTGRYPFPSPLPCIPGGEVFGPVEEVGPGVDASLVGRRFYSFSETGGYAQFALAAAGRLIPEPPGVSPMAGLALLVQGLTAALILKRASRLKAGESVLVEGAAGGVGVLAVQLAKLYGAGIVVGAASTEEKRKLVRRLGADAAVDYTAPAWPERVKEATAGRGVDIILEMTGGAIFEQGFSCLAPFGRCVVYGMAGGMPGAVPLPRMMPNNQELIGFYLGGFFAEPKLIPNLFAELAGFVRDRKLTLQMGDQLPLSKAGEMHRRLEGRKTTGKCLLLPWAG
jgi:NADPH2:quinone reductase